MARRRDRPSRSRPSLWVVALLVASLAVLPAIAPADGALSGSGDPNYTVYGGCGTEISTPPAHLCHKRDPIGAFFRSNTKNAGYDVCLDMRHSGGCMYAQFGSAGVLSVNDFGRIYGPALFRWKVGGVEIGSWQLDVYPDPVVPKFGVNPLIVSRTHSLFGLVLRHIPPGLRVRAWRRCSRLCPLPLRLTSVRSETRRYELAGSAANSKFTLGQVLYVQVDAPGKQEHGYRVWGRLYRGEFVRDRRGGPRDTAVQRVDGFLCTPPDSNFRAGVNCAEVAKRAADYPR